jgi:DNA mismatch endonuclease, patch repair protein
MSRIRGRKNRSTELAMVALLRAAGIKGWRRHRLMKPRLAPEDVDAGRFATKGRVSVRPDFVFGTARLALFVDGCFWHGCPLHATKPAQNAEFWERKLSSNVERDAVHTRALEAAGWTVLRVWEHELRQPDVSARRGSDALRHAAGVPRG